MAEHKVKVQEMKQGSAAVNLKAQLTDFEALLNKCESCVWGLMEAQDLWLRMRAVFSSQYLIKQLSSTYHCYV